MAKIRNINIFHQLTESLTKNHYGGAENI